MPDRQKSLVCSHCEQPLRIEHGGWAYMYTQILLHLDRCAPELSEHERQELAKAILNR